MERLRDDTALFGVAGHPHAARVVARGLAALGHRGSGAVGVAASDGVAMRVRHGPAPDAGVAGRFAVGQRGDGLPLLARTRGGMLAVALAGRLTNAARLRRELDDAGTAWWTRHDAEILLHLVARSGQRTTVNRIVDAMFRLEGGFSVVLCVEDRLIAGRDPRGLRPLWLGRVDGGTVVSTEDAAIVAAGGEPTREVEPGELVIIDAEAARSVTPFPRRPKAACLQELVALGGPDARASGRAAHDVRGRLGERLARERGSERVEVVLAVPGAEVAAAGFARAAKVPFEAAVAVDGERVRITRAAVAGKRVGVVASELTDGRGLEAVARALGAAGAAEVHARVACPPLRSACVYGVEGPPAEALAAPSGEPDLAQAALAARLGVDTIAFLPLGAFEETLGVGPFCEGCLGGEWPVAPEADGQLPLFRGVDG